MKFKSCLGLFVSFILFIIIGMTMTFFHFRKQFGLINQYKNVIESLSDSIIIKQLFDTDVEQASELSEYEFIRKSLAGLDCTIIDMNTYIDVKTKDEEAKFYKGNIDIDTANATIKSPFSKIVIIKNGKENVIDFYDLIDKQINIGGR